MSRQLASPLRVVASLVSSQRVGFMVPALFSESPWGSENDSPSSPTKPRSAALPKGDGASLGGSFFDGRSLARCGMLLAWNRLRSVFTK